MLLSSAHFLLISFLIFLPPAADPFQAALVEWANFALVAFGYLPAFSPIKQNHFDRAVLLADLVFFLRSQTSQVHKVVDCVSQLIIYTCIFLSVWLSRPVCRAYLVSHFSLGKKQSLNCLDVYYECPKRKLHMGKENEVDLGSPDRDV